MTATTLAVVAIGSALVMLCAGWRGFTSARRATARRAGVFWGVACALLAMHGVSGGLRLLGLDGMGPWRLVVLPLAAVSLALAVREWEALLAARSEREALLESRVRGLETQLLAAKRAAADVD